MDSEERTTKRLHVSGLTQNLTAAELARRLSNFGTVKAVDGFGLLNAVGLTRDFGYVTIETTESSLRRCLNALSGTTYKGAKLRIAEARPDFRERLEKELASAPPPLKLRKRAKCSGAHAADMSLVTAENVHLRGREWKVTHTGRILRTAKLRPERPLVLVNTSIANVRRSAKANEGGVPKTSPKRRKVEMRPHIRTIDMLASGSVHLKGAFVDIEPIPHDVDTIRLGPEEAGFPIDDEVEDSSSSVQMCERRISEGTDVGISAHISEPSPPHNNLPVSQQPSSRPPLQHDPDLCSNIDLAPETAEALRLVETLFMNPDWGRTGSISDGDEADVVRPTRTEAGGIEVDPSNAGTDSDADMGEIEGGERKGVVGSAQKPSAPHQPELLKPPKATTQVSNLKDLFAPQEENVGFSLMGHLNLDLEMDDEIVIPSQPPALPSSDDVAATRILPQTKSTSTWTPDPTQPFFFPTSSRSSKLKDPLRTALDGGWHWHDPAVGFYRAGGEEDIRKRWEEVKVDLTRDWKKRWREASKARRRRAAWDPLDRAL